MEPCTPYHNHHYLLTVMTGSQHDKTCWPYRIKLISKIKRAYIAWGIINVTGLVCREVHSVPTGVGDGNMKERYQQVGNSYYLCVVRIGSRMRVKYVPLQLFASTQPIPTVQSARLY